MNKSLTWKVLLIGGCSGVGKTYLAKKLSEHFSCPYLKIDDLRYFMQKTLEKESEDFPALFSNMKSENDNISGNHFIIANFIKPGLNALIEKYSHYHGTPAMIIEGIEILPESLGIISSKTIKGIFLYDTVGNLSNRMTKRSRGKVTDAEYNKKAKLSVEFCNKIVEEAKNKGFYTIEVTPEETLVKRAINLIAY